MTGCVIQWRTVEEDSELTLKVEKTGTKSHRVMENCFEIH